MHFLEFGLYKGSIFQISDGQKIKLKIVSTVLFMATYAWALAIKTLNNTT